MWSISLILVCTVASAGAAEVACAADTIPDGGDDSCLLLQKETGVLKHDGVDHQEHLVKTKHHEAKASVKDDDEGIPDFMKKLAGKANEAFGGVAKLEKDFEGIKTAVEAFKTESHDAIKLHLNDLGSSANFEFMLAQVEKTYTTIYASAIKLHTTLSKAISDFLSGVGKIAPAHFTSAMKTTLEKIDQDAKSFADSFKQAAQELKQWGTDRKLVCSKAQHGLDALHKKVEELASSALGISTKGLDQKIVKAKDALPGPIKQEIEKVLHKANEVAEHLKSSLLPAVQEISNGVASALHGHCGHLHKGGAGRMEVGLLSAFVIAMLGFSM